MALQVWLTKEDCLVQKVRKILVALDLDAGGGLDPCGEAALEAGLAIARHCKAIVTLMHVISVPESADDVIPWHMQTLINVRKEKAEQILDAIVDREQKNGLKIDHCISVGSDWHELLLAVTDISYDLVITGSRGRGIISRMLFGSVSNRLLRYCPVPVLAVKSPGIPEINHIMVAHDLSPAGNAALQGAAFIAGVSGARVSVLHVLELPEQGRFLGEVVKHDINTRKDKARQLLEHECAALGIGSCSTIHVTEGEAYASILDFLRKHPADLLSMGTVSNSGFKGVVVGNTAENILPWVNCSLLAVKPEGFVNPVSIPGPDASAIKTGMR